MRFRKPELIPLLFIVTAFGVCATLGVWQLERLAWKEALIADIESAQDRPVLTAIPQLLYGLEYRKVELSGTFLTDKSLHRVGSRQGERPGVMLLTPFRLTDGRVILVNRGFSPNDKLDKLQSATSVTGVLRPAHGKRAFFIPDNQPERNLWLYEDIAEMRAHTTLNLLPLVIEATGQYVKDVYPIPSDGKMALRNDHFGYAITWFSLAIVGLVLFGIYYREKPGT